MSKNSCAATAEIAGNYRKRFCLAAALLLVATAPAWAATKTAGRMGGIVQVTVRVVDESGARIGGAEVELVGIERYSRMPIDWEFEGQREKAGPDGMWSFVTDANGECVVRFRRAQFSAGEAAADTPRVPVFGEYYLLAMKTGFAGGISHRVDNLEAGEQPGLEPDEWANAKRLPVKMNSRPWQKPVVIVLYRGVRVSGQARDVSGNPLAGVRISIHHDLHAGTHTGAGGEFWAQEATTGADGGFHIDHVYPGRVYIYTEGHWARTHVDKRWIEGPIDYFDPSPRRNTALALVFSPTPLHRYAGQVVDKGGKPVPNLKLCVGLSMHWPPESYGDEHHFEYVVTGADGRYQLESDWPYARFIEAVQPSAYKGGAGDAEEIRPVKNFNLRVSRTATN